MIPSICRRLLTVVFLLSFSAAASAQQQLNWFWWKSEPTLALSPEQSTQIEGIFQEGIAQLQRQKDELDRLEAKELIKRQRCPKDRRQHLCWIAPKGLALLQKLDAPVLRWHEDTLKGLRVKDRATFVRLLDAIRAAHE